MGSTVPGGDTGAAVASATGNAVVGSQNHPQSATATVTDTAAYGVLKAGAMVADPGASGRTRIDAARSAVTHCRS